MSVWHVLPQDDLREHVANGVVCWCHPEVETQPNGSKIIIHNSMDGREFFEEGEIRGH